MAWSTCRLLLAGSFFFYTETRADTAARSMLQASQVQSSTNAKEGVADLQQLLSAPGGLGALDPSLLQGLVGAEFTPEVVAFVKKTILSIEPMFDTIKQAHANDTQLRDEIFAGFATERGLLDQDAQAVQSKIDVVGAARQSHLDCRTNENTLTGQKQTCDSELSNLKSAANLALQLLLAAHNNNAREFNPVAQAADLDVSQTRLDGLHTFSTDYINANRAYKAAKQQDDDKTVVCTAATQSASDKKAECDAKQAALESATCSHSAGATSACSSYTAGYAVVLKDYNAISESVRVKALDRKAEWEHLKKIKCVLGVIAEFKEHGDAANSTQKFSDCYQGSIATDFLTIADKPAPAEHGCPATPVIPCSQEYTQGEYSNLPSNAPAATCLPCTPAQ